MPVWVGSTNSTGNSTGAITFETAVGLKASKLRVHSGDSHLAAEDLNHSSAIRVGEAERVLIKVNKATRISKYNAVAESWTNEDVAEGMTVIIVGDNRVFTFTSEAAGSSMVRVLDRTLSPGGAVSASSLGTRIGALPIGTTGSAAGKLTDHILPDTNAVYDLGSAEKKIRHLFLSDNSLWVGDEHKVSISGGKMKFRKRKKSTVPAAVAAASGDEGAALAHAGVATLADMKLEHWREFMRTLPGQGAAEIKDIFRDNSEDYEDDFEAGAASGGSSTSQTIVSDMAQNQITTLAIASGTTPIVQIYEDVVIPGAGSTELDVLRLHLDSDFTDSSTSGHTVTAVGNTAISTSEKKFGAGSAYFDGNGDCLEVPASSDFDFGTNGDFTIEMWVYFNSFANHNMLANQWSQDSGHTGDWQMWFRNSYSGKLEFFYRSSGSWASKGTTSSAVALNTWTHLAVVRSSGTIKFYFNGVADSTTITDSLQMGDPNKALRIGQTLASDHNLNGYIDDVRITKGLARYTENFTVPAAAHPDANSAGTTELNATTSHTIAHDSTAGTVTITPASNVANAKLRIVK